MVASHPWRKGLWAALVVVLLSSLWVTFAPTQAGGNAAYVIVAGASMNPALQRGDLVIVRKAPDYGVSDIVAYQHPTIGPIIHRILAAQEGTFTLKGDANSWVDSYSPSAADILGKAWIRLPGVGRLLAWLRQPIALGLVALLISLLVVTTVVPMSAPENKHGKETGAWSPSRRMAINAGTLQTAIFILGIVSLLSAVLAIAAWTHSISRQSTQSVPYEHRGTFAYTATVPLKVYGEVRLEAGEPVYLRLTRMVDFYFDYRLSAEHASAIRGTARLLADVSDTNGWHRTIELRRAVTFEGESIRLEGALDLNVISSYLQELEDQTGVTRPFYTLAIYPEILVQGDLAGNALESAFAPKLKFLVDKLQMQVLPRDADTPNANPMEPSDKGALEIGVVEPNRISILGATVAVAGARRVAGIGLVIGLGGLALLAVWFYREQQVDPAASIQLKYGAQMAELQAGSFETGGETQEMASIDDLARIAEKSGQMIYWILSDPVGDYFVHDAGRLYHFRLPRPPKMTPADEAPSGARGLSEKDAG